MVKISLLIFSFLLFVSCKNEADESCSTTKAAQTESSGFEMYERSEMAALMEQMYSENLILKEKIISGDTIGKFPAHFTKIHNAVLTDQTDKDTFFEQQAKLFIEAQELIYNDAENAQAHYNKAIDACISCHQVKCGGPISKIKKLYID